MHVRRAPTRPSTGAAWQKAGNVYWLAHDIVWGAIIIEMNKGIKDVRHALRQALFHANELGLAGTPAFEHLQTLKAQVDGFNDYEWSAVRRRSFADELYASRVKFGNLAERAQPNFQGRPDT